MNNNMCVYSRLNKERLYSSYEEYNNLTLRDVLIKLGFNYSKELGRFSIEDDNKLLDKPLVICYADSTVETEKYINDINIDNEIEFS